MNRITAEDAFKVLARWNEAGTAIQVVMSRSLRQEAASAAILDQVLLNSQKVLVTLKDENGEEVGITVDLIGAEWENDADGVALPDCADVRREYVLVATFPNGNRYAFEEKAGSR